MDDRTAGVNEERSAAAQGDSDARARELRSEIAQTREELSETVDAIQEKLRPSNVAANAAAATTEKVKDMAYSAAETAEEWWDYSGGSTLVDRIRNNPIPAAVAGVGIGFLVENWDEALGGFVGGLAGGAGARPRRRRPP